MSKIELMNEFRSIRDLVRVVFTLVMWGIAIVAQADWQGPLRESLSLPERNAKPLGFVVNLTCDDLRLFGEIPIHVQVAATGGAFTAERSITIRVSPTSKSTQPPGLDCVYDLPVQLVQGQSKIEKTFYAPKWSVGGGLDVVVLEDRRVLEGYQGRIQGTSYYPGQSEPVWWESAEQRFGWLVEDGTDKPDARVFFAVMAPELLNVKELSTAKPGFDFGSVWRQFRVTKIDDLPSDWRGFDVAEVWIAEVKTLRSLMKQRSVSTTALRNYLCCGGTLWVLGEIDEREITEYFDLPAANVSETNALLETAITAARPAVDYESFRASAYQPVNNTRGYIRECALNQQGLGGNYRNINPSAAAVVEARFDANLAWLQALNPGGTTTTISPKDFDTHSVALGRIVICKSSKMLPGTAQQWRAMACLTDSNISTTLQRGVDPSFGDRRFWDWIIPDVAQPPVYTFIGLLALFVVVVGPLAYRKCTQLGRGYLIMFIAPLLALVTTLTMFVYGLVADGLSTRVRVREMTCIGDTSGTAARYSRATYFAGVRPSAGMKFPGNAVLMPYQLSAVPSWYDAGKFEHSTIGTIRLEDDVVCLDSAFMPSRQQKQFVTYRPVEGFGVVRLQNGSQNLNPTLQSTLAIDLRQGIVCDRNTNYFSFDRLPNESSVELKSISKKDASELLSALYGIQRPIAPAAISSSRRAGDSKIDMIAMLESHPTHHPRLVNRASTGECSIESWLRTTLQIQSELPPGMFIAVADVTDDCIAVDAAEVVESVHFVIGELP